MLRESLPWRTYPTSKERDVMNWDKVIGSLDERNARLIHEGSHDSLMESRVIEAVIDAFRLGLESDND